MAFLRVVSCLANKICTNKEVNVECYTQTHLGKIYHNSLIYPIIFIKLANERFDAGTFNYVFEANLFVNELKSDPRIQKLIKKVHNGKD